MLLGGVTRMRMSNTLSPPCSPTISTLVVVRFVAIAAMDVASKMPCQLTIEVGKRSSVFISALESQAHEVFARK